MIAKYLGSRSIVIVVVVKFVPQGVVVLQECSRHRYISFGGVILYRRMKWPHTNFMI